MVLFLGEMGYDLSICIIFNFKNVCRTSRSIKIEDEKEALVKKEEKPISKLLLF